jgi:TPR repeat protein/tRNA A-37 threonylcarbamoyl transferase component Bud32
MTDDGYPDALPRGFHLHWYLLERVLGQGGFGITYLARDTNLDQRVAIKEYLPIDVATRRNDATVRARTEEHDERYHWGLDRFIREARTLARFDHPNIVRVLSVFEFNNTAYMVMRFEEGSNLAAILEQRGTLPESELLRILLPILDGLELVHNAGFIHRDIKPDNVHVRADGSPVLLDFGSARQPVAHSPSMTILVAPGYAPFEQYYSSGESQGPWSDIYGLGATCYRAISGTAPMDAIARSKGVLGSARDVLTPAITVGAGRYSQRLLKAIDHALEFAERDRPQSIAEWRRELLGERQQAAPPPVAPPAAAARSEPPPPPPAASGGGWPVFRTVLGAAVALAAVAALLHFYPLAGGGEKKQPVASPQDDAEKQLKERLAKIEKELEERNKKEEERLRQQKEQQQRLLEAEAARKKQEAEATKLADERQAKAAQQAEAARKKREEEQKKLAAENRRKLALQAAVTRKQREEEQKKLAAERALEQQTSLSPAPVAAPLPVAPPPSPAQQLRKAEQDYAAGKYAEALATFKALAESGNADAQLRLGKSYAEGHGVPRDDARAAIWYRKAALQGNAEAQSRLGELYATGHGVPHSDFEAYVWFSAAVRGGNAAAKTQQERVAQLLQPVEIEQAGKLVTNLPLPRAAQ